MHADILSNKLSMFTSAKNNEKVKNEVKLGLNASSSLTNDIYFLDEHCEKRTLSRNSEAAKMRLGSLGTSCLATQRTANQLRDPNRSFTPAPLLADTAHLTPQQL